MVHAVFVCYARRIIHGEHQIQRRILWQILLGRFDFRTVVFAALDGSVCPHAHLVGLVCFKVFCRRGGRNFSFFVHLNRLPANSKCHIDRGGVFIKVIAETGVLVCAVVLLLIDCHGVTIGTVYLTPRCRHDLVSSKVQCNVVRRNRMVVVRVAHLSVELLIVDGDETGQGFHLAVLVGTFNALFRHEERGHIVAARGCERTALLNLD